MLANNYRPITLGSTLDRLYNAILNRRLYSHVEAAGGLHDAQQGFREGRSAVDNVHMLTTALRARAQEKLTTFLLFVDIEKAYDSVWRAGLMHHIWESGVRGKMFRVLHGICTGATTQVMHAGCMSHTWQPDMGWEQGDTLATTVFSIHVNHVLNTVWQQHPGVPVPNTPMGKLVALLFADDLVGLAASAPELQAMMDTIAAEFKRWRIKASVSVTDTSKTAVMVVGGNAGGARRRSGQQAPQVQQSARDFQWGGAAHPRGE